MKLKNILFGASAALVAMGAVAGCGSAQGGGSGSSSTQKLKIDPKTGYPEFKKNATITWWSWVPNAAGEVKIFEKYYPNIKVKLVNAGAGTTEYTKFSTVLQSGSGVPDVVMLEYDVMPQYISSNALADITPYVKNYKDKFPQWVLNQVTYDGRIYGVPEDTGPLGLFYQKSVFDKYHLKVPTTWEEYKQEALAFHKQNPKAYFTYFLNNDAQWIQSLFWQAGVSPVQRDGDSWKVNFTDPKIAKVLSYWKSLVDAGAVDFTASGPSWEKNINNGVYATAVGAAWFDSETLVPWDHNLSQHKWHVAFIPQWQAGQHVDGDFGGSVQAVTKASKNQEAAAIFATFINTQEEELKHDVSPAKTGGGGLFPASSDGFKLDQFNAPNPALDNQRANKEVFAKASSQVYSGFQWSPWSTYVFNQLTSELSKAFTNKESIQQALQNVQDKVVTYGKSQGYKVTT
ncbi:ABC transporter substrate-binding protein [Alicyclobacillus shizuokensis]|uniref:ABC transporter substrate-binding protein n=1 Tax=Alicyclobacillus shizuokensis TaxID=392014 RepID=UPI0008324984|nr:extracellular solute-binding protein [Alicyclobacillus shizuokensis]